MIDSRNAFSSP